MKRKRFISLMMTMLMVFSFIILPLSENEWSIPIISKAVSQTDVEANLNSLIKEYKDTTWNDYYYGIQCKGFANLIFFKLFEVTNIGAYDTDKYYIPSPSGATEVGKLGFSDMSESNSKTLLQKGYPGDYIQVRRRGKSYGHSMILVGTDNNGITVFDCNSDGKNGVKEYYVSYSDFYSKNSAMSLYHANNYTTEPDWEVDTRYPTPFQVYPEATSGKITVYNSFGNEYSQDSRYIAWDDLCTISAVYTNGFVRVTYPSGNSTHTEYARFSAFATNRCNPYSYSPSTNAISYTRANMSDSFGEVFSIDNCTVVSENGNKLQLIYPAGDGYKLGWITKPECSHNYTSTITKAATCTVDGEKTFTCSICGYSYKESIKAIGHRYIDTVKSPTYTEEGYTLHTCSVCNDSYKDNVTLPSGHVMEESEAAGQTIPNGDYWIYNEHDMNYFLDVPGVELSHDGANVQMWYDSSNMPSEFDVWTVTYLENGFYKIRQRGTNLCLDVSDASINRGANVQLSNDNSSFAQQWSISKTQHGYTLQARCSSYNLDVIDGKIESGTNVRTWSANDQKAQSFCFIPYSPDERPIEDGVYNIQSVCNDNYYLDISGEPGEYQNNSNAQIWNGATDKFKIVYAGDGWYKIYEESTGLALEVNNGDDQKCFLHNERNIQLYENNASRGQFWKIRKTDDGHYFLISKLSGYYLDLLDGKCTDAQNVSQVYYIGGNPQKWNFIKVNTKGDLNDDGEFNISDVVLLQKWLLAVPDTELANWRAADLCEDGKLDAFDMIEMRKLLIQNPSLSAQ